MKKWMVRILALLSCLSLCSAAALAAPGISAEKAILTDACTGRVLYERSADSRSLIASTTKIMTAVVAAELCPLDEPVKIMPEAVGVEGSSMYLQAGETLTVQELLYGLLLHSGNDAAVALAIHCAGSVEAFADKMNEKAAALGLKNTHFVNPNGLDAEGHYSTARDLAVIAACAMENETLRVITATKSTTVGARCLTNHNRLLWRYEGAVGVKTGYTKAAGRILVSAAERGGRRLIAVTINAPNDWADHAALLDYGFGQLRDTPLITAGETICRLPLLSGGSAALTAEEGFSYPLFDGEEPELRLLAPELVWSAEALQDAALLVLLNGKPVGRVQLAPEEEHDTEIAKDPLTVRSRFPAGGGAPA